jgi:hypothetical protein
MLGNKPVTDANSLPAAAARPVKAGPDLSSGPSVPAVLGSLMQKRSIWPMTIIRGQKVEEAEIKLRDKESEETQTVAATAAAE